MGQRGKREGECQLDCADVSMLSGSVPGSTSVRNRPDNSERSASWTVQT